jgi:hypothetical protein
VKLRGAGSYIVRYRARHRGLATRHHRLACPPLSGVALDPLRGPIARRDYVNWWWFPRRIGGWPLAQIERFRASLTKMAEGCRLHDGRHGFALHSVSSGLSLESMGRLRAHRSAQTAKRYAQLADEAVRAEAVPFGARLSRRNMGRRSSGLR